MTPAKTKLLTICVLIVGMAVGGIYYVSSTRFNNQDLVDKKCSNSEIKVDSFVPLSSTPLPQGERGNNNGFNDRIRVEEEEKRLMAIVSSWRQDLYDKGKIKKQPIALAIDRLGEMQSMNAIPLLVAMVKFGYYEGEEKRSIGGLSNFPGIFKISPSLRALKNIGTPAVAEIIKRLGQIPDEDDGYLERYLLHQALLHILEREKAVELLNKNAEAATDENVKSRLKKSAQTVSHLRISE